MSGIEPTGVESGDDVGNVAEGTEAGKVEDVRQAFVQLWGSMGPFWGISPTTARVHSWLLSRAEPADTDEIMQGLEMSRGAVSMACRDLREWHLIFPEKAPGSRRVTYRPATDLEKVIRNIVELRKRREWDPILESLREWIPLLEADPAPEAQVFRQRLESLESLIALTDSMVESFLKGGLMGRVGLKMLVRAARREASGVAARSEAATTPPAAEPSEDSNRRHDQAQNVEEISMLEDAYHSSPSGRTP